MEKIFTLSIIVSQLEDKMSVLSAEIALRSHASNKRLKKCGDRKGDEKAFANEEESHESL